MGRLARLLLQRSRTGHVHLLASRRRSRGEPSPSFRRTSRTEGTVFTQGMKMTRHWTLFGLVCLLFTPAIVFELSLAFGSTIGGFPVVAKAAIYPLSLVFLDFSPFVFRPGSYESPQAGVEFSKGARYAIWATVIAAFPFALFLGIVYQQFLIGVGFFLIAFGSTTLLDVSVAGTYGYLLVKGEGVDEFFSRATKWFLNREMRIIFWLSLSKTTRCFERSLSCWKLCYYPSLHLLPRLGSTLNWWRVSCNAAWRGVGTSCSNQLLRFYSSEVEARG